MEISIKTVIVLAAVIFTGLSAGFFFAWSVSVIPGTQKVTDSNYLETMQSINRAILNPAFFIVFFGSLLFLSVASFGEFHSSRLAFWLMLSAAATYLIGTIGVTGMGNVPLNNQLDALNLAEMAKDELASFRKFYEQKWNRLHQIRTGFAIASFLLATLALWANANSNHKNLNHKNQKS